MWMDTKYWSMEAVFNWTYFGKSYQPPNQQQKPEYSSNNEANHDHSIRAKTGLIFYGNVLS